MCCHFIVGALGLASHSQFALSVTWAQDVSIPGSGGSDQNEMGVEVHGTTAY